MKKMFYKKKKNTAIVFVNWFIEKVVYKEKHTTLNV